MLRLLFSTEPAVRGAFFLMAAGSAAFLIWRAWPDPNYYPVDFKYFWLAGKFWLEGAHPYGAEFILRGQEAFPDVRINPFFYPPSWRLICSALALMPQGVAETVWAFLSAACIAASSWIIALTAKSLAIHVPVFRLFALTLVALTFLTHGASVSIGTGQPSPFLLLAFCGLIYCLFKPHALIAAACLTALLLKPQIGVALTFAAFFSPPLRQAAIMACVATAALSGFGLFVPSPLEAVADYRDNLSVYGTLPENWAQNMSGLNFIASFADAPQLTPVILLCLTCGAVGLAGWRLSRSGFELAQPINAALFLGLSASAALFLMPTHNTDLLMLIAALPLLSNGPRNSIILAGIGAFLFMRSMSLSVFFEGLLAIDKTVIVSFLDTAASLLLLAAAALHIKAASQKPADSLSRAAGSTRHPA